MARKTVLEAVALSTILFASLTYIPHASFTSNAESHLYIVMGGTLRSSTQLGTFPRTIDTIPFASRSPDLSPTGSGQQEITFSDPDPETGIINLTVQSASYVGVEHIFYDPGSWLWYKISVSMDANGYGWLFTATGTTPVLGDVDCYTHGNNSGVYWGSESPFAGLKAAGPGEMPDPGPDGVAGTDDDGFGDGTADPTGASVLYMPTTLHTSYWMGAGWIELFSAPWPQVLTTGTAYGVVIEPASMLNGVNYTAKGEAWEFLAGLDHSGEDVDWDHPYWNAYVTYACSWSVLDVSTALGDLDVVFEIVEMKVREDVVIADLNCDETVNIMDIYTCAKAFGAKDEGPGPDGLCNTGDDKPVADQGFDGKADIETDGVINIRDIFIIAKDFGKKLTPTR